MNTSYRLSMGSTAECDESISTVRQRRRKLVINESPVKYDNEDIASEMEEEVGMRSSSNPPTTSAIIDGQEPSTSAKAQLANRLQLILASEHQSAQQQQLLLAEKQQILPSSYQTQIEDETRPKKLGILEFVGIELTRGYSLHEEEDRYMEKRRKVYAFVRIPYELEKFLFHGFLQCLDSFCHIFTFLPIRILLGLFGCAARRREWTTADTCDVLKVFIILAASWFMLFIDTSALYHVVRGQGVIKLYIFYNMLEVLDKLLSSFGQDILDALLWTASERDSKRKFLLTIVHLAFAVVYALGHAILVLLQATTLNVAFFNMHNNSLLTIMMSNNFVELKGSVFKKFGKPNLFQLSCSDVRERFHTVILLIVVVTRIMTAVNWDLEHLTIMIPDLAIVIIAEYIVDWLKHAFITKFNEMSPEVYQDFTITLAFDVVRTHEKTSFSDFSDQVSRRMGFIPIPISIMLIRVIGQSVDFSTGISGLIFLLVWIALLATKVLTGVFLHSRAVDQVNYYRDLQNQARNEVYRQRKILTKKSKSAPGSPKLSLIDFSDVLTQATCPPKTMTVSDMLAQYREFCQRRREPSETKLVDLGASEPPRRCQSMVDFRKSSAIDAKCNSIRPSSIPEAEVEESHSPVPTSSNPIEGQTPKIAAGIPSPFRRENSMREQMSPQRKLQTMECESLSNVQAYTLLNNAEQVEQFQS